MLPRVYPVFKLALLQTLPSCYKAVLQYVRPHAVSVFFAAGLRSEDTWTVVSPYREEAAA